MVIGKGFLVQTMLSLEVLQGANASSFPEQTQVCAYERMLARPVPYSDCFDSLLREELLLQMSCDDSASHDLFFPW